MRSYRTRIERIEAELNSLYEAYCTQVQAVAERVFQETIQPMLAKQQCATFIPGNGTWYLEIKGHQLSTRDDGRNATERALIDLLSIEVHGMAGNDLGSLM